MYQNMVIDWKVNAQLNWNNTVLKKLSLAQKDHVMVTCQLNWHFIILIIYLLRLSDLNQTVPFSGGKVKGHVHIIRVNSIPIRGRFCGLRLCFLPLLTLQFTELWVNKTNYWGVGIQLMKWGYGSKKNHSRYKKNHRECREKGWSCLNIYYIYLNISK